MDQKIVSTSLASFKPCEMLFSHTNAGEEIYHMIRSSQWPVEVQTNSSTESVQSLMSRRFNIQCFLYIEFAISFNLTNIDFPATLSQYSQLKRIVVIRNWGKPLKSANVVRNLFLSYKMFVVILDKQSLDFKNIFFYCSYCVKVLQPIHVTSTASDIDLMSFQSEWSSLFVRHICPYHGFVHHKYRRHLECASWISFNPEICTFREIIADSLIAFGSLNISLTFKKYFKSKFKSIKEPVLFLDHPTFDEEPFNYFEGYETSAFVLQRTFVPKLLFCDKAQAVKSFSLLPSYFGHDCWWFYSLAIIFTCALLTQNGLRYSKTKLTFSGCFCMMANKMFLILKALLQQRHKHKVALFVTIEVLTLVTCSYFQIFNLIMSRHFFVGQNDGSTIKSLDELMDKNYTYVYAGEPNGADTWVEKGYRHVSKSRIKTLSHCCDFKQLEKLFVNKEESQRNNVIHLRLFNPQVVFDRLQMLVSDRFPCHMVSPIETVFESYASFAFFKSAFSGILAKNLRLLQSLGHRKAVEATWKSVNYWRNIQFIRQQENYDNERKTILWIKKGKQMQMHFRLFVNSFSHIFLYILISESGVFFLEVIVNSCERIRRSFFIGLQSINTLVNNICFKCL